MVMYLKKTIPRWLIYLLANGPINEIQFSISISKTSNWPQIEIQSNQFLIREQKNSLTNYSNQVFVIMMMMKKSSFHTTPVTATMHI